MPQLRSSTTTIEIAKAQLTMTQESTKVSSPMQRRLAARRLEFDDEEQDSSKPPDSAGVPTTVLAAPPEGRTKAAAQQPGTENGHDLGMRRDLDSMMAQIAALSVLVHDVFAQQAQMQQQSATPLRSAQDDDAGDA